MFIEPAVRSASQAPEERHGALSAAGLCVARYGASNQLTTLFAINIWLPLEPLDRLFRRPQSLRNPNHPNPCAFDYLHLVDPKNEHGYFLRQTAIFGPLGNVGEKLGDNGQAGCREFHINVDSRTIVCL